MIIFGSQKKGYTHHTGPSPICPNCGGGIAHYVEQKHNATLYFIPVGGGTSQYSMICVCCGYSGAMNRDDFFNSVNSSIAGYYNRRPETVTATLYPPPIPAATLSPQPTSMLSNSYAPPFSAQPTFQPPSEDEINEKVRATVAQTAKKYKRDGWTRTDAITFFDKTFPYCPFCGKISDWSCDNSEGLKYRFRCDKCLGEFYGIPHIKKPEKNKFKVINTGYFNKSSLALNNNYTLNEINNSSANI